LVFTGVYLFIRTISQKPMKLGTANLTQKCPTISSGNPFIFGVKRSKVKITKHKNHAGMGFAFLRVLSSSSCCSINSLLMIPAHLKRIATTPCDFFSVKCLEVF